MQPELLAKIRSRGHWRINFQPLVHAEKLPTVTRCEEIVEENALQLRGWEYPAILRGAPNVGRERTQEYFELSNDWENHIEFWRMYKSGQFLHYLALREDWFELDSWHGNLAQTVASMTRLAVVGTIYTATEIYEFLSRLTRAGLYEEGVAVNIALVGTRDRSLWLEDAGRMGFSYERRTGAERLGWSKTHTRDEILQGATEISRSLLREWFDAFGWQAGDDLIGRDQQRLLTRNL